MILDVRTMYIAMGMVSFVVAAALLVLQTRRFGRDGALEWALGWTLQGASWVLVGLRGIAGDFLSIVVGQTCLIASYSLLYAAVRQFRGRSCNTGMLLVPVAAVFIFEWYFSAYVDNLLYRIIFVSLLSVLQIGAIARTLLRHSPVKENLSYWLTGFAFLLMALVMLNRLIEAFTLPHGQLSVLHATTFRNPGILVLLGAAVLSSIGFVLMIRERAEERTEHLASFPRLNPNPVMEVDVSGTITFTNPGAQAILEKLALDKRDLKALLPHDLDAILRDWDKRSESTIYREVLLPDRVLGETIHLVPHFNVAQIYALDITERKRAEEQLAFDLEATSRLQKLSLLLHEGNLEPILTEIVDAAIAISGADFGNIQLLDPASSDLKIVAQRGFPRWWLDFWDHVSRGQGVCGTALERGERVIVEDVEQSPIFVGAEALEIQLKAGVRAVQSTPLVSRSGRVLGMFSTHFKMPHRPDDRALRFLDLLARHAADTIDRVQADEALKKAHDELEIRVQERTQALGRQAELLELAYEAIIVREPDSRVAFWNARAEEIYGFTRDEALGRVTHALLQTRFPVPFEEHREVLARQGRWQGELVHTRKDGGQIVVLSRQALQKDESGRPLAILEINLDITERKQAEEETKRYASQLELSNRELQDFAFAASHDLQEPLRKILAFGDQLRTGYGERLDAEGLDYLNRMQNAAVRMQALIQALLNYSRVTTKARPFSITELAQIAREVAGDLEASIRETGGRIEIGDLPKIESDPTQMRQLFQNLIGNALKFHGDEKPVVKIYGRPGGGETTRDGQCQIFVEDNGIGFDEKYLDRIFTPFQRLHRREAYEGTGIGLAICRKIADRHGGSITAKSAPGKGSTFIVTLPAKQPKGGT